MEKRQEGTTVAGGVTWSLGVAVVLMVQVQGTRRFAHGGFKVARIYSSRWSVKIYVPNICVRVVLQLDLYLAVG